MTLIAVLMISENDWRANCSMANLKTSSKILRMCHSQIISEQLTAIKDLWPVKWSSTATKTSQQSVNIALREKKVFRDNK